MRLSALESCALHAFERCTPRSNRLTLCSSARSPCSSCSTIFSSSASCSSKLGIDRRLIAQAQNFSRRVEIAERCAHLHTLHLVAHLGEHLLRNRQPNSEGCLLVRSFGHACQNRIWHRDTQIILHELRITQARQRP